MSNTYQYEMFRFFYWVLTDSAAAKAAEEFSFATVGSVSAIQKIAFEILSEVNLFVIFFTLGSI